ncbi:hypothetical protein CEXT_454431 [Caerostris extrusa]|uniref:Uncharacterized protein n=1 Tax=Caerostris extrusa TaxID=172846 RepID=A0AAV4QRA4_CAEEX|nr:hypothetical protein CEXT_454431 [Caerostris extrusa]
MMMTQFFSPDPNSSAKYSFPKPSKDPLESGEMRCVLVTQVPAGPAVPVTWSRLTFNRKWKKPRGNSTRRYFAAGSSK